MAKIIIKFPKAMGEAAVRLTNKAIARSNVGETIVTELQENARKGINPKTGKSYKKLEDVTIDRRKQLAKVNRTHKNYSARKSNLTFTGQLIDSMFSTVKALKTRIKVTIDVKGKRRGYKSPSGKTLKSPGNKKVAEGLADQGRPLVDLSKKLKKIIAEKIIAAVKRKL